MFFFIINGVTAFEEEASREVDIKEFRDSSLPACVEVLHEVSGLIESSNVFFIAIRRA